MKPKRQLYSINALSLELDRDRAAVTRALHNVTPDGTTAQGQPRFTLATAVRAIENRAALRPIPGKPSPVTTPEIERLCDDFDAKLSELKRLKTVDARRAFALRVLSPMIDHINEVYHAFAKEVSDHDSPASIRADSLYYEQVDRTVAACDWKHGGRDEIIKAMPYNVELAAKEAKLQKEQALRARKRA